MRVSSQLLLTFLLNACWQIAFIAAFATFGSWLLRNSVARYRHWLWVSALCLAFIVPAITSLRTLDIASESSLITNDSSSAERLRRMPVETAQSFSSPSGAVWPLTYQLNQNLGLALITFLGGFILYRGFKLVQAWLATSAIRRLAVALEPDERVADVIRRCEVEFGSRARAVRVFRSETLPVPVTIGLFHPVIILPEPLLREGNIELLTSAIGHEFIHVTRRDYLLNLIYELLFVPISFHPAAAFLRRRVRQTRELCCDELVAERILNAEVYARSLVRLASSAPPLRRLSITTTVGIADADILEARIMSLLRKPELKTRWKKLLLFVVSLLLLVPSVAATAFAFRFKVNTSVPEAAQDQERKAIEKEKEKEMLEMKVRSAREVEMKDRMSSDPQFREEIKRKQAVELEMRDILHSALVRLAKINMDQAIQIATSQQPGKVLLCSLGAKGWEEPGKLGKDGVVFYHVIIADETKPGSTHLWINAIDGSLIKTEMELPRKMRSPENP